MMKFQVVSLLALTPCAWTQDQIIHNVCFSDGMPIVLLRLEDNGEFTVVKRYSKNETNDLGDEGQYRHLEFSDFDMVSNIEGDQLRGNKYMSAVSGRTTSRNYDPGRKLDHPSRHLLDEREEGTDAGDLGAPPDDLFYARECSCLDYGNLPDDIIYCPYTTTECREQVRQSDSPLGSSQYTRDGIVCQRPPPGGTVHTLRDAAVLGSLLTYISIAFALFLTQRGRRACNYLPAAICGKCWNRGYVDYLLRYDAVVVDEMLESYRRLQRGQIERRANEESNRRTQTSIPPSEPSVRPVQPSRPTSLALRTRYWIREDEEVSLPSVIGNNDKDNELDATKKSSEEDYDHQCIICMIPLCDGDRVGVLPCKHIFHVDCLKLWLRRCNACPMCKREEVAAPRYGCVGEVEHSTTESMTESPSLSSRSRPS